VKDRKLDTSTGAGGEVTVKRTQFDDHLSRCTDCQPLFCHRAEARWRDVCVAALRARGEH
jgi:hypothetical protein